MFTQIHGISEQIRDDNGPVLVARQLCKRLVTTGAKTLYSEPGSPWESGYCQHFNSKMRNEEFTFRFNRRAPAPRGKSF